MSDPSNIPLAAWWGPRWRAVLLAGSVATTAFGCGGEAQSDAFSDAGGSSGSGGTGGGSGGTATGGGSSTDGGPGGNGGGGGSGGAVSTAVTATSGSTTTGSATTAGGSGGGPDRCSQPIVGGDCEAAIPSFGYNTKTGACEAFTYGGCGGNDNRFETLDECMAACDPGGRVACETSSECVIDHDCCDSCEVADPADLVAVNQKYASYLAPECELVLCAECTPSEERVQFGARCNAGSCEVYDVRRSLVSECNTDADCQLRAGLGCCEGCGDNEWVAVSADDELVEQELCDGAPVPCPACAPPQTRLFTANCGADGHCAVEATLF